MFHTSLISYIGLGGAALKVTNTAASLAARRSTVASVRGSTGGAGTTSGGSTGGAGTTSGARAVDGEGLVSNPDKASEVNLRNAFEKEDTVASGQESTGGAGTTSGGTADGEVDVPIPNDASEVNLLNIFYCFMHHSYLNNIIVECFCKY